MSLINDALKKAQKQRTDESAPLSTMPGIGGEPAARIAKRAKPLGFNSLLLWIGVGAGGVLIVLVGGFFLVRWMMARPETPPPAKPALVAKAAPVAAPATTAPLTPAPTAAATKQPEETAITPYVLPTAPTPKAAVARPVVVEAKPVFVVPVAPPPEPPAPKPLLKLSPKAVAYIEGLHVAGIRASTTDSKALMNDRVYRVGDTVEHQLGIKLAEITASSLTFEDELGARYTPEFLKPRAVRRTAFSKRNCAAFRLSARSGGREKEEKQSGHRHPTSGEQKPWRETPASNRAGMPHAPLSAAPYTKVC